MLFWTLLHLLIKMLIENYNKSIFSPLSFPYWKLPLFISSHVISEHEFCLCSCPHLSFCTCMTPNSFVLHRTHEHAHQIKKMPRHSPFFSPSLFIFLMLRCVQQAQNHLFIQHSTYATAPQPPCISDSFRLAFTASTTLRVFVSFIDALKEAQQRHPQTYVDLTIYQIY